MTTKKKSDHKNRDMKIRNFRNSYNSNSKFDMENVGGGGAKGKRAALLCWTLGRW